MRGKGAFWVSLIVFVICMGLGGAVHRVSFMSDIFQTGHKITNRAIGEEYALVVKAMPSELKPRKNTYMTWAKMYWPDKYASSGQIDTRHKVAGWILGIWTMILVGFSISFAIGAFVSAGTLTYLIVREEEEFLEPVIDGPPKAPEVPVKAPEKKEEKEEPAKDTKKDDKKDEAQTEKKESKSKRDTKSKKEGKSKRDAKSKSKKKN